MPSAILLYETPVVNAFGRFPYDGPGTAAGCSLSRSPIVVQWRAAVDFQPILHSELEKGAKFDLRCKL
jgi:hypothetical protein